jgi:hypothetical protein
MSIICRTAGKSRMPSFLTRAALALAVAALGACSDDSDGDLATWCTQFERASRLLLAVDADDVNAGDPAALEAAAEFDEAVIELRETDAPAEIRETFEIAFDPAGFQPDAPAEYSEARDELEEYVLANCDLPPDLQEQLRDS